MGLTVKKAAALLESGKFPPKKEKSISEIRSYLRHCTLDQNGLVVAKNTDKTQSFQAVKTNRIVIPTEFSYSYVTILHRKFGHPPPYQMLKRFNQQFFTLDALSVIKRVQHMCQNNSNPTECNGEETFM